MIGYIRKEDVQHILEHPQMAQKIIDLAEPGEEIPIGAFYISDRPLTDAEKEWAVKLAEEHSRKAGV